MEEQLDSKLPVMVWIHGGAFEGGASNDYGPEYFMDEDVVIVTINYRLGTFGISVHANLFALYAPSHWRLILSFFSGFLSTGDEHIRGNMGLKDQALALKWVKENIEVFGGDPQKSTIFGESAG